MAFPAHGSELTHTEANAFGDLPELFITATRTPSTWLLTPGSGSLVKGDQFIRHGGSDFGDVVRYDPTVSAPHDIGSSDGTFGYGQTGYSGYNIRGMEGNRILMLVDGIRQPEQFVSTSFSQTGSSAGGAGRDYYDPAMFEATEILKGSASALYGSDALGGVVAFRTPEATDFLPKDGDGYAGMLRGQHFSRNASYAAQSFFALRENRFSLLLGLAGRCGHETENNGNIPPNPARFNSENYLLKASWKANEAHDFSLTYEHFLRKRSLETISANNFSNIFDRLIENDEQQQRDRISLHWNCNTPDSCWFDSVKSHLYYQRTENSSRNHSESRFGRIRDQHIAFTTETTGYQSIFRKHLSAGQSEHDLNYGIDISHSRSENTFNRTDNGLPFDRNRISFAPSDTLRTGLFVQDQFKPSESSPWTVIGGIRLDYYRISPDLTQDYLDRIAFINRGRNAIEPTGKHEMLTIAPKLDIIYQLDDSRSLYFQYSHGVRNPTAEELSMIFDHPPSGSNPAGSITLPNPGLEEEKSHAFEIGYKQQDTKKRLNAALFYTRYSDFIENGVRSGQTSSDGRDILTTVNRGSVDIYGFEIGASWQFGEYSDNLTGLEIGISTGRSWGIDRERGKWLNTIEPWKSIAWIGYTAPSEKFGTRLTATYVDRVKHIDDSAGGPFFRPPSYFTLDLSGYWKINDSLTLQAGINNLLDEKYWRWSSTRRGGGHIGNSASIDDRSTAPGVNGFLSLTYQF